MASKIEKLAKRYDLFEEMVELERPLEEFSLFGSTLTEVNAAIRRDVQKLLIPEIINEQILTVAEENRIARNLCSYIKTETDSMTWLKERGFEAMQIEEGSEIEARKGTYEKFTLVVKKIGVRPVVTNEMVEDSRWDIIRRNLDMATMAMTRLEDKIVLNSMIMGVPNGIAITAGVGGIGEQVSNHYVPMGDLATGNTLNWKSIALGLAILRREFVTPDTMLIHPNQMVDLMTGEGDFIGANERAYMTLPEHIRTSMMNGTIGNIGGMNVIVSSNMTPGYSLMFDSSQYSVFLERRPLSIDNYDDVLRDMQGIVMTQRFTSAAVNREAGVLLYGGKEELFP